MVFTASVWFKRHLPSADHQVGPRLRDVQRHKIHGAKGRHGAILGGTWRCRPIGDWWEILWRIWGRF